MAEAPTPETSESALSDTLGGIWARIKEHKVIQWTLGYLAAALALAHGAELVSQGFEWPHAVFRIVIALLALGLPIAVALAWYHGHKGLRRVSQGEAMIVSLLLIICAVLLVVFVQPEAAHETASVAETKPAQASAEQAASVAAPATSASLATSGKPRLAVLPFRNLSPDPANAFFADGLHEEILSTLANRAPGLEVISATTMLTYKERNVTLEQVAKELGCSHVLEGSVRREGDAVRLTLQLIDARSDQHIWAEDFDRTLTNSLTLQSEVAGEVASKLSTKLSGVPKEGATVTKDPVAYDIYLKARIARQLLAGYSSIAEWQNVATLLDQAIAKDPGFALAYVARFDVYFWLFTANYDATPKTLEHARADLAAAEKLAPNDAAVLGAKAQWAFIEQDYSRALDLYAKAEAAGLSDPNLLIWKNITLAYVGRFDEGIAVLERAVALDPANVNLLAIWGATLMGALRPAEGLKAIDLAIARVPNAMPLRAFRENARYAFTGDSRNWDKLVETEVRPTVTQTGADDGPTIAGVVDWLLVKGRYAEARQLIDDAPYDAVRLSLAPPGAMYGVPYTPTALFRGQCDLLLGDMTAASKDGAALLAYVGHQDETNWNKWFLRELAAAGQLLQGNKSRAINLVHEALAAAPYPHGPAEPGVVEAQTVWILAWAGAQDEAMNTLERLATTAPGLPPASIAQAPIYTVPLAANTRFQALKAKLETQMAATKLE